MDELERAIAFEEALREATAKRTVSFAYGTAFFHDRFPRVWYLNVVRAERPADARTLAVEAERLHAGAGHEHRLVSVPDPRAGEALAPQFRELGWRVDRHAVMAYRGPGERRVDGVRVEELDWAAIRPLREALARAEPWATEERVVQEVVDAGGLTCRAGGARHFAVRAGSRMVSAADLYSDGRTAQVEEVATLPSHRGRGYASAIVVRAVEEALAGGHDFVFLTADDEDWPKALYGRLGFEPVGLRWSFLRPPAGVRLG